MIGTSDAFKSAVSTAHEHVAFAEVVQDNAVIRTLPVHSGSVDADRSNRILRRFECALADADGALTPEGIRDLLAPFGTTVRLHRGVRIPTVTTITVVDDSPADWAAGTRIGTVANAEGDLVLGNT